VSSDSCLNRSHSVISLDAVILTLVIFVYSEIHRKKSVVTNVSMTVQGIKNAIENKVILKVHYVGNIMIYINSRLDLQSVILPLIY